MPKRSEHPSITAINGLSVSGFKSIADRQSIEVRPLTILAGANSSGKSSSMRRLSRFRGVLNAFTDRSRRSGRND
jgi:predicted ATPase